MTGPPHGPARGRWARSDDAGAYAAAQALDADHALWWVWWSPYRRRFTAIWQGPGPVPVLEASSPRALRAQLRRIQHEALARRPRT